MRGRSVFTILGVLVALIVALVVIYFAWVGWREKGKPIPDVDVKREDALVWPQGAPRT